MQCVLLTLVGRVSRQTALLQVTSLLDAVVCFHSTIMGSADNVPALQELGDSCRRLRGSHSVDVQVSLCMQCGHYSECSDAKVAKVVKCLVPHLCGMSVPPNHFGISLQPLLPAAAQLERLEAIETDSKTFSLLGQFPRLKELCPCTALIPADSAPASTLHTVSVGVGPIVEGGHSPVPVHSCASPASPFGGLQVRMACGISICFTKMGHTGFGGSAVSPAALAHSADRCH